MQPEQVWNRGTVLVNNLAPVQQLVSSRYSVVCLHQSVVMCLSWDRMMSYCTCAEGVAAGGW